MRQKTSSLPPRMVWASSSISFGTDFSPSTVSITTAKQAIRKAMAIFGAEPVPSQMTNNGATATFGIEFSAMIRA